MIGLCLDAVSCDYQGGKSIHRRFCRSETASYGISPKDGVQLRVEAESLFAPLAIHAAKLRKRERAEPLPASGYHVLLHVAGAGVPLGR